MRRRTVFAAPFVLVVAGCGGGRTYRNPPPPREIPVEECRAIIEGSTCTRDRDAEGIRDDSYCSVKAENPKCGLQGYSCEYQDGGTYAWKAVALTSNECQATPDGTATPPEGSSG